MKFTDSRIAEQILSDEAKKYWPQDVIKFYEQRIYWIRSINGGDRGPDPIETTANMLDDPSHIICE